ncbi:hypothetical protein GN958_ATG03439 [Phytophthora infestans]|uniref:Uncharacterized protein n=1 Tax=Phytophthora infestans TaxID=4787 RepID=A0A8S9V346_PHYIN|nr:hypothetical protein GN958_ATG17800 [Phytophthora infestans]KAF4147370.1 hypothetical protein GN958_ATG03439 [Phytophthora infestans]
MLQPEGLVEAGKEHIIVAQEADGFLKKSMDTAAGVQEIKGILFSGVKRKDMGEVHHILGLRCIGEL